MDDEFTIIKTNTQYNTEMINNMDMLILYYKY